jgi:hypothetical protein
MSEYQTPPEGAPAPREARRARARLPLGWAAIVAGVFAAVAIVFIVAWVI